MEPLTDQEVRRRLAANLRNIRSGLNASQTVLARLMSAGLRNYQRIESAEVDLAIREMHSLTQRSGVKVVHIVTGVRLAGDRSGDHQDLLDEARGRIDSGGAAELAFIVDGWRLHLSQPD